MNEFISGNKITLLKNGEEYFPALEQTFDQAECAIYLETYIFRDDAAGSRIAAALIRAARRKVAVHVVIDGFGSQELSSNFITAMENSGVKVRIFRKLSFSLSFRLHRLRRLHRKLVVVDYKIAFVGGINIQDDFDVPGVTAPRTDFAVAVEGPLVAQIYLAMFRLWRVMEWLKLKRRWRKPNPAKNVPPAIGSLRAQFLIRDNIKHRRDIEAFYLAQLDHAKSEVIIANAYFLPGHHFRNALLNAAGRGVHVTLMLQGRVEYFLLHYATRAMYGDLLAAGVELHEYHKSFLHAKVAVFDGRIATVGSSNIDPFSLFLAREANVVVDDPGFANTLRGRLVEALELDCTKIVDARLKNESWFTRALSRLSFAGVRLLMGLSGYAFDEKR